MQAVDCGAALTPLCAQTPSATVWMNAVVGDLAGPLFQSWNPHVEPHKHLVEVSPRVVLARTDPWGDSNEQSTGTFHRPVMTLEALKAIDALGAHQGGAAGPSLPPTLPVLLTHRACCPAPGQGNLWFVGAFARRAVPLLESGVATAAAVATRLGCKLPEPLEAALLQLAATA